MNRSTHHRWVAGLALAFGLTAPIASAEESGTITVGGTFQMEGLEGTVGADLAQIYANGVEHTWAVTLTGATWTRFSGLAGYTTSVEATVSELQFFGPDAAALNSIVAEPLAGARAILSMRNSYQDNGPDFGILQLQLLPAEGSTSGISFWADHDTGGSLSLFPTDTDGYPTVTSEPCSIWVEMTGIEDGRPGNGGRLTSWENTLTVAGDIGTPVPTTLSIADGSVLEGNRGSTKLSVRVTLANTSSHTITVGYRTVNGSALAKSDYTATSGTLTFPAGTTSLTITIPVKADRTVETDETFTVELFNAVGTTLGDAVATATIRNDD
jgi:hypothetical protein